MTADEVIGNISGLRDQLNGLVQELAVATSVAEATESLLDEASNALNSSESLLQESGGVIAGVRSSLLGLRERLAGLESDIEENEHALQEASNLTSLAAAAANETQMGGADVNERFEDLDMAVGERLEQSQEDLVMAREVQNQTCELQVLAQQQLLHVENLIRIEQMLMVEQEVIRDDIERVANEIEVLDNTIRIHISRNTACLDTGVLEKRRKKRKRRSVRQQNH